ncbi:TetR/AcrR family transcriptional regulator [Ruania halotolerans]|uniref:TetR/AcrR family transcriptional regulator n=1 Tax=Ruania halotolerans TaxID=2897773 RepID=UPI001E2F36B3|nr:TetR/AcrR family transcriptional regulator [Ruania halotolerans]UFU05019.1 TetR/AcrR family transcriptional regulator [Ruania halotolerans]
MSPTPRERARVQTEQDILRIARNHLATQGPAGLSLRAVARDLGVVSSAVYRYVRSRDELLTLLVVEGYNELGDAVDEAMDAVGGMSDREQFFALGRAVRAWARREPAMYALLYGTPVPGYEAPGERTVAPGTRVVLALARIVEEAWANDRLTLTHAAAPLPIADLERIRRDLGYQGPPEVVARTIFAWAALFGCVNFEIFDHYGADTFTDIETLFDHHLAQLAHTLGLTP